MTMPSKALRGGNFKGLMENEQAIQGFRETYDIFAKPPLSGAGAKRRPPAQEKFQGLMQTNPGAGRLACGLRPALAWPCGAEAPIRPPAEPLQPPSAPGREREMPLGTRPGDGTV